MVAISNLVSGSIVANATSLQQTGIANLLILGNSSSSLSEGSAASYANMVAVSAVFNSSQPDWLEANAAFGQSPTLQQIYIGRELDRVAQVTTITFGGADASFVAGNIFAGTINQIGTGISTPVTVDFITNDADTLAAIATAFNIAGKGIADPTSMIEAILLACRLTKRCSRKSS